MRINYSGEKRRRELALKQKKEEKAKRLAERKALKTQQTDETAPDPITEDQDTDRGQTPEKTT